MLDELSCASAAGTVVKPAFFAGAACAFALPFESAADFETLEKSSGERYTLLR